MPGEPSAARLRTTTPVLVVADVAATMRWYQDHLHFRPDPFPESPPYVFCILRRDDVEIMLQLLPGYEKPDLYKRRAGGVWDVYVRVHGVRKLYHELSALDAVEIREPLRRLLYGQIEFAIEDPNGYTVVFAEPA